MKCQGSAVSPSLATSWLWHWTMNLPVMQKTWVRSLGWEDALEKETATHSSTLDWEIPWAEEPGRLQSMGSQRVRHDRATHWQTESLCASNFSSIIWGWQEHLSYATRLVLTPTELLSGLNKWEQAVLGTEQSLGKHHYHHYSWEDIIIKTMVM